MGTDLYQKGGYRMMTIIEKFGCKDLGGFLTAMTPLRTTPKLARDDIYWIIRVAQ